MKNKTLELDKLPSWLPGIIDTLIGAHLIKNSNIPYRNRLSVILLDSAFETACRTFLQYAARITLTEKHRYRDNLISTMKSKLTDVDNPVWDNINYFYNEIRCDFYHISAGKTIPDESFLEYFCQKFDLYL